MLRELILRLLFVKTWLTRRDINFKGWCVIHSFKGSYIEMGGVLHYVAASAAICWDYISVA